MEEKSEVLITSKGQITEMSFRSSSISDVRAVAAACEQIRGYIADAKPKKVVFDFSGVKFFSSQVLGMLVDIRNRLCELGGEIVISAIDPQLYRVFKITNLNKIFRFFPDKKSAIESLDT